MNREQWHRHFCLYNECSKNKGYGRDNYAANICYKCEDYNRILDINDGLCKVCLEDWCDVLEPIKADIEIDLCANITCGNASELNDDSLLGTCFVSDNEHHCLCSPLFEDGNCTVSKFDEIKRVTDIIEEGGELKTMGQSNDLIVKVNENDNDPIINVNNKDAIKKVKVMSNLVKSPKIVKEMKPKAVKTLFHTIATTITKMIDGIIDTTSDIVHLYDLAKNLVITTFEIRKNNRLRYLLGEIRNLDDDEYKLDMNEYLLMIKNAGLIFKKITQKEIEENKFNYESFEYNYDEERGIHYRKWTNNNESYGKLKSHFETIGNPNSSFVTTDLSTCTSIDKNIVYITIIIPNTTYDIIKNEVDSNQTKTTAFDLNDGFDIELTECNNITAYFEFNEEEVNLEKYKYYKEKNIDIYKKYEEIVQKTCYVTKDFDYDLTQKYRRKEIYENKTFNSSDCIYDSIDLYNLKIKMNCNYVDEFIYSYYIQYNPLDNNFINKVDLLPLKCTNDINITKNIGFWLYIVLIFLIILLNILSYFLNNEKLYENNFKVQNNMAITLEHSETENRNNTENVKIKDNESNNNNNNVEIIGNKNNDNDIEIKDKYLPSNPPKKSYIEEDDKEKDGNIISSNNENISNERNEIINKSSSNRSENDESYGDNEMKLKIIIKLFIMMDLT